MKKNYYSKTLWKKKFAATARIFTLLTCLVSCYNVKGRDYDIKLINDSAIEKKVDYLEEIYFSGENKQGLNQKILIALQKHEGKSISLLLTKQLTFLQDIKDKADAAEGSCEILEMLAVGIYNIDAAEAAQQGVRMPSDKAKAKAGDALASLNKLNSSANNLSGSASSLAWSSFVLSGGNQLL